MTFPNSNVLRCLAANAVPKKTTSMHKRRTQTQVKNRLPKFLNRLGGSVTDWGPYGGMQKQKRPARGRPFLDLKSSVQVSISTSG
jgi:hypothetical protein